MRIRTIGMTALLIMMAAPAIAQRGRRRPPGDGMRGAMDASRIERALRMRERLELTEDQITQLDALRRARVAEGQTAASELAELQSQFRARLLSRDDFRDAVRERREAAPAAEDDPLDETLTEDQASQLDRAGRRGGMRGMQGFRGRGQMEFRGRARGEFRGRGRTESRRRGGPDFRDRRTP
ncbi:MAG: hypothetical protein O7I93_17365 [Gemmatimonadetes bacterium]|nr:hypothetical protein [Gemmatimonadota bacterium]